jgi:hypothetical protein
VLCSTVNSKDFSPFPPFLLCPSFSEAGNYGSGELEPTFLTSVKKIHTKIRSKIGLFYGHKRLFPFHINPIKKSLCLF